MLQSSSATELMGDFGVICFDTLCAQTHLHSNFITKTLSANSNSGLRNSYGVYEKFYFENVERMCGCVSDAGTVIAPEAAVNLGHNWDGCVVCEVFSNGGEFHRVPGNDFPDEEPTTIEIGHRAGLQLGRVQEIVRFSRRFNRSDDEII